MYYLGVDLGGTNIAVGVVDEDYQIIGRGKIKTNAPRIGEEILSDMITASKIAVLDAGLSLSDIGSIGVGYPGAVDPYTGANGYANNLGYCDIDISKLGKILGMPSYIENDANAAAYAEFLAGSGKGKKSIIAVTLGTGVGGGIIIDGKILGGVNNAAGELGHTVIVMDGEPCSCGRKGCWEAYASATALIKQTKAAMAANPKSYMWKIEKSLEKANGRTAFVAMKAGDFVATGVVKEYIDYVSCGIVNLINTFQPELICIGGGISHEGDILIKPIVEYVKRERYSNERPFKKQTEIVQADLGNDAGIIGAAFLHKLYNV